jgi:hypothetical protein
MRDMSSYEADLRSWLTTGNPGFAEGLKLSAKGIKLSAQAWREIFSRPRFFAEHSSSRLSAQSGPSAKKSSR